MKCFPWGVLPHTRLLQPAADCLTNPTADRSWFRAIAVQLEKLLCPLVVYYLLWRTKCWMVKFTFNISARHCAPPAWMWLSASFRVLIFVSDWNEEEFFRDYLLDTWIRKVKKKKKKSPIRTVKARARASHPDGPIPWWLRVMVAESKFRMKYDTGTTLTSLQAFR